MEHGLTSEPHCLMGCLGYRMAVDFLKTDHLFLTVGVVGGACSDVEQTFIQVTKFAKREKLFDFLKTIGKKKKLLFQI